MNHLLLLRQVNLIDQPAEPPRRADVWIEAGCLTRIRPAVAADAVASPGWEPPAWARGRGPDRADAASGALELDGTRLWLGPPLIDPHSVLDDPDFSRAETLDSLRRAAAAGGYGQVALLPWATDWRDRPDRLRLRWPAPMGLHLWGSFSVAGAGQALAPHADQLEAGALGLASADHLPPLELLERGLRLGEMGQRPVLLAPRDLSLTQQGFVRERVEALRAGWPPDPVLSEQLPLQQLLTLQDAFPQLELRLMNLSTAEAVACLARHAHRPPASVCWWHLVADSSCLAASDEGWRLVPSLGGPADREALIAGLAEGTLTAVAVHHQALDAEERLLPLDQRRPGLAGHGLALSLLWQELVVQRRWRPEQLWQALCWGPAAFLGWSVEQVGLAERRWILFNPDHLWRWDRSSCPSLAANQPFWGKTISGAVVASGFSDPDDWRVPGGPSR
ncbi:MAG: dihydroorotase [Synechococcaceae cyanobacterium]|nr:dihydroorotase [Synechococcaceae cyanobacterium]